MPKLNTESLLSLVVLKYGDIDFKNLSSELDKHFTYYEILFITDVKKSNENYLENHLNELKNIRVILINDTYQREVLEDIAMDQAIGDIVIFYEPGTDLECIYRIAETILKGKDFVGVKYNDSDGFSIYAVLSWIFYKLIYLLTGTRIPTNLSNTLGVSRNLISAISENRLPHRYLKLMNAQFCYESKILPGGGKRPKTTLRQLWERLAFGFDVLGSASPRLIKFASILALSFALINGAYIFYVLSIYLFKSNVQEGWATTSLVMASMFSVLFFVLSVIGITCSSIMRQDRQIARYGVVREITSSGVISTLTQINVETDLDCIAKEQSAKNGQCQS